MTRASTKKPTTKRRSAAPPAEETRRRRTAEEARAEILDAAERRLVRSGPAGIRLQEVAADVGVSHPTVLHHFGSREALVREVCERRFEMIHADVVKAIGATAGDRAKIGDLLGSVFDALAGHGHGRVVFWLALEGLLHKRDDERLRFDDVATATHALRQHKRGKHTPPLDDTKHIVALSALVLLAGSVLGPHILRETGLGSGAAVERGFRDWFAHLVADHLEHGPRAT